jgi:hypothetical protein
MTESAREKTVLDQHMAVVGRVIAKFVSEGLAQHDIDSRAARQRRGQEDL